MRPDPDDSTASSADDSNTLLGVQSATSRVPGTTEEDTDHGDTNTDQVDNDDGFKDGKEHGLNEADLPSPDSAFAFWLLVV
jgi:hypothetical protein